MSIDFRYILADQISLHFLCW